jgi:hypothetical protein
MKESNNEAGPAVARDEHALGPDRREIQTTPNGGAAAEEQIRMRAYELYRERGGKVGDDMADWLRAEREYLERGARRTAGAAGQRTSASTPSATRN